MRGIVVELPRRGSSVRNVTHVEEALVLNIQDPGSKTISVAIAEATDRINVVGTQALPLSAFYPQGNREQRLRFGI